MKALRSARRRAASSGLLRQLRADTAPARRRRASSTTVTPFTPAPGARLVAAGFGRGQSGPDRRDGPRRSRGRRAGAGRARGDAPAAAPSTSTAQGIDQVTMRARSCCRGASWGSGRASRARRARWRTVGVEAHAPPDGSMPLQCTKGHKPGRESAAGAREKAFNAVLACAARPRNLDYAAFSALQQGIGAAAGGAPMRRVRPRRPRLTGLATSVAAPRAVPQGPAGRAPHSHVERYPRASMFKKSPRPLLQRPVHRPGHGQYPHLCARPGHRAERTLGGRDPPGPRPRRPRSVAAVGSDAKRMLGRTPGSIVAPADEGRRDRRLHHDRSHAAALHQAGAQVAHAAPQPARAGVRALRFHPGGTPRHQGVGRGCRRTRRVPDRGTHGRRHRRRHSGARGARLDGAGHRRRHLRGRGDLPQRRRLRAASCASAATASTRPSSTTCAATTAR